MKRMLAKVKCYFQANHWPVKLFTYLDSNSLSRFGDYLLITILAKSSLVKLISIN
jgi:hypothetical protein